ncbi:DUF6427 family protein [uncultured Polaribacter sp.]|uniref:DUF6427 family protein n=1 Tax=uncultured Polaribacter sp. TaxID=174711 RepID=UPI00345A8DF2
MASFSLFANTPFEFSLLLKIATFLVLFLIIFFFYNFIVSKNDLTFDNSYAFFIFTIFLSYFLKLTFTYKTLLILLLYILFLRKIYSLRSHRRVLQKLFDSGFWLSVLFILEPFTAMFSILIFTAIYLHQKPIINNLIAPVFGFLAPLIIYFSYCFWFDELYVFTNLFYFDEFYSLFFYSKDNFHWIVGLILALSVISIFLKSPKAFSVNNSFKKSWILLIIHFIVAVFFSLLIPNKNGTELLFLLFPTAVIIANGLEAVNSKFIRNVFIIVFLISAFALPFLL